ncbi:MAG: 50S ribosomal protein L18 [Gammaproteobacteria bacterium]
MDNKTMRLRRARRARAKLRVLGRPRLCVHRTLRHVYAQIIAPQGDRVLVSASTLEPGVKTRIKRGGNVEAAAVVGEVIAERARLAGISLVGFDRSGFKYHGRVKALADAGRAGGLEF